MVFRLPLRVATQLSAGVENTRTARETVRTSREAARPASGDDGLRDARPPAHFARVAGGSALLAFPRSA